MQGSFDDNTKKTIIAFLLVAVGLVLFLWLVMPKYVTVSMSSKNMEEEMGEQEGFNGEQEMEQIQEQEHKVNMNAPHVNAETGTLLDGPGFDTGVGGSASDVFTSIPSNYYFLDDGANGEMSIVNSLCSPSCCSEQWATPFKQKYDPYVCANKDKFVPSNIMCNNSFQDSGCLCMTKPQQSFLYNRGGNGRELF